MKTPTVSQFFGNRFGRYALVLLLGASLNLTAAEYYVDYAAGSDGNQGSSPTLPWKHCPGDPAATAIVATTALAPGDTVHFKGGVPYVFTGGSGIVLRWNGTAGSPITYDGNSSGAWGSGRARFTDNHSAAGRTAFSSPSSASYLAFRNLDIGAMGGAATLPADSGLPVSAKFGGGIAFGGAVTGILIDSCQFQNLGYAFNRKPMSAASIAGTAVAFPGGSDVSITNCNFTQTAVGIDLTGAVNLSNLSISNCTFSDGIVWTIVQPVGMSLSNISIFGCTELNNGQFDHGMWAGYGGSPRVIPRLVTEGSSTTFTSSAIGTPSATFQWRHNGVPIAGATAPSLTLFPVSLSSAGTYTVEATNSAGATVSNEAVLVVASSSITAPVIFSQPVSTTVEPSGTATFAVVAFGSPTPTYQWMKNGTPFPGWMEPTLILADVSSNDVGAYSVVVSNSEGTVTSDLATLTVGTASAPPPDGPPSAPVISVQPASLTVDPLSTAVFSVTASGSPAPTYQWLKNGNPISGWIYSTLTLSGVSSNDVASYQVVVSNSEGSVTSEPATLFVGTASEPPPSETTSAPVISVQPASLVVEPLSTAVFSVEASGSPEPAYQWRKNGNPIAGWTNATLELSGVSSNDVASYQVVVSNSAGTVTSDPATLSIATVSAPPPSETTSAPVISVQPTSLVAEPLSTAVFSVTASGSPAPTYQWRKNGNPIAGGTNATLELSSVSSEDVASYQVVVSNSAGTVTSDPATLTVGGGAPVITSHPLSQIATRFATVTFNVTATGDPSPSFQWTRNGNPVAGGTNATLTLTAVSNKDGGTYAAIVTNSFGSVTSNPAKLTVQNKATLSVSAGSTEFTSSTSRLVNVSVQARAGTGTDSLVVGFVVEGGRSRSLLIRASGPALAAFGVPDVLADPSLAVYSGSSMVAANGNWGGTPALIAAFERAGAFPLTDSASKDAAVIFTAAPGAYTVEITGAAGDTAGTVLVEVYELP